MILGMWQYYYTIRDEFCQPLLYTKFKKKEVDRVREERDRIRLMLYRNTLTNAWLVNRLEERGVITEKTEMSSVLRGVRKGAKAETIMSKQFEGYPICVDGKYFFEGTYSKKRKKSAASPEVEPEDAPEQG